jgi:actin-related protein 3
MFTFCTAIAIKESASVGDSASRRIGKGMDDLDFHIGDEALNAPNYSVKVRLFFVIDIICNFYIL